MPTNHGLWRRRVCEAMSMKRHNKFAKEEGITILKPFFKEKRKAGRGVLIFVHSQCSIGLEDTSEKIGSTIAEDFKKFVKLKTSI